MAGHRRRRAAGPTRRVKQNARHEQVYQERVAAAGADQVKKFDAAYNYFRAGLAHSRRRNGETRGAQRALAAATNALARCGKELFNPGHN